MALFRRFFVPADGLVFVFFHSQAIDIAEPKVKLRGGVPLFGGFPVPVKGLVVVLRGADAVGISPSQVELGCNVAQFRRLLVAVEGFLLVFRHPASLFVVDCQLEQRLGVSFQSYLLKGFYVDGIGGDGVFLLAVVVGSVIHFTGNRTGEHWDNFCSPELVRSPILHISPIRIKTRFYWGRSSESFTVQRACGGTGRGMNRQGRGFRRRVPGFSDPPAER